MEYVISEPREVTLHNPDRRPTPFYKAYQYEVNYNGKIYTVTVDEKDIPNAQGIIKERMQTLLKPVTVKE